MSFRGVLGQDRHISEYQVQQTVNGARVLTIVHGSFFSPAPLEKALVAALAEAGLHGARVTVEPVAELPRHPETKKLKALFATQLRAALRACCGIHGKVPHRSAQTAC
jgi:phenylacetate-CoA ligase